MQIALQLKTAQSNAERQIQALDRVADRLRPAQVLRWVERVLDDRCEHIDRIGHCFHKRTNGTLKITFATPPQEVKEISHKLAQALMGGQDASQLKAQLISSFRFADVAGRILFDSTLPVASAKPGQKLAKLRREMAECRSSFKTRRMPPRLLHDRCRMILKQGRRLQDELSCEGEELGAELDSFKRFSELVTRVAAA